MKIRFFIVYIILIALFLLGCSNKKTVPVQFDEKTEAANISLSVKNYDKIKIRLFTKQCPKSVEGLLGEVENGEFNYSKVTQVVKDAHIVIESSGQKHSVDFDLSKEGKDLYPFYGAVCVPKGATDLSRLVIINSDVSFIEKIEKLLSYKETNLHDYILYGYDMDLTEEELNLYRTYGGAPWFFEHFTVIGQVVEGLDIIDKISDIDTNGDNEPKTEIIITEAEAY